MRSYGKIAAIAFLALFLTGCFFLSKGSLTQMDQQGASTASGAGARPGSGGGNGGLPAGLTNGTSARVATSDVIVRRIEMATGATHLKGNFKTELGLAQSTLPTSTDPQAASGLDQIPLLAYAACADVAPAKFGVTATQTIAQSAAALAKAGVTIMDRLAGGLCSTNAQCQAIFTRLVAQDATVPGETTQMVFVSVCTTALAAGLETGF